MKTLKHPSYTYTKGGIYYFSKVVPQDLAALYAKPRIIKSLRTKSLSHARTASRSLLARLEDYWLGLRLQRTDVPAAHLLVVPKAQLDSVFPTIEDALELYLAVKGQSKGKLFFSHARRNISYVIACLGSRPLDCYSSADAATFRQWLIDKKLSNTSLVRIFGVVKAVVNFSIKEQGLECKNSFSGVYIPAENNKKRYSVKGKELKSLQDECVLLDDDIRWLVALISDTGMRLSEAIGLAVDDLRIKNEEIPYVIVQNHPWRRLKTKGSERKIPLVGASLWAAKALQGSSSRFAFPRYVKDGHCYTNSASAALNKWLRPRVPMNCSMHSFRHSIRDRLRAVGCPSEVIDQIGGWSSISVGQKYGEGFSISHLMNWIKKIV